MNIAFLSSAFLREKKESTTITLLLLARALQQRGHRVVVISEAKKGYPSFEEIDSVPIYRLFSGWMFGRILAHVRGVRAVQKKLGITFDAIHGFSAAPVLAWRTVLARYFCSPHATAVHTIKSLSKYARSLVGVLNRVDTITMPTQVLKDTLVSRGVDSSLVHVVRSFIDTNQFVSQNKNTIKKKYRFSGKKVVLYYGSLFESKGVRFLLQAFPSVLSACSDALLVLAVRHSLSSDYGQLITSLGLGDHIRVVTGMVNTVEYVNAADVVVLPYIDMVGTEGNPSCLLEAVACRTPVVTTEQPELLEIFGKDELFYASVCDAGALARQIVFVLKNKKEAEERAGRAVLRVEEFYVEKAAGEFEKMYQKYHP